MKKHIPNSITCCNLISGCIATAFAFTGDIKVALLWIIIGAVFDFFDGMTARLLHVSSPIGKELDSLADDITFGVAPSTIIFSQLQLMSYPEFLEPLRPYLPFVAYIMAAFSALRLAKFNLDERQALGFIGLPTPANALFWGSLLVGIGEQMYYRPWTLY
ncbi:MAG: CDP-alcohol phosphatidyltransferase family protein, partial [Prevotella sp.]|nr:CDP-alcohol phosphatidyltransferase family protein [Prevotella sp.]